MNIIEHHGRFLGRHHGRFLFPKKDKKNKKKHISHVGLCLFTDV